MSVSIMQNWFMPNIDIDKVSQLHISCFRDAKLCTLFFDHNYPMNAFLIKLIYFSQKEIKEVIFFKTTQTDLCVSFHGSKNVHSEAK
jgi:hypothetical protein